MQLQWNKKSCPYMKTQVRQVQQQEQTLEVRLSEEQPDIGRVLCACGQPIVRSKEWRGDGMHVSGGISVSVLYLAEDGSGIKTVETWLPFQAKWNFSQAQRECVIRANCLVRELEARIISARKMMIRANMSILAEAMEPAVAELSIPEALPKEVELLTNVYPAILPREAGEKQFFVEEELIVPDVAKWIGFSVCPVSTEENIVGDRIVLRGYGMIHYIYLDTQGMIRNGDQEISFAQFADLSHEYDKEATADVIFCVSSLEHENTADGVRIHCGMNAQYRVWDRMLLEIAEDAYSPNAVLTVSDETLELPVELDNMIQTVNAEYQFRDGRILETLFLPNHPAVYREGNMAHIELSGVFHFLYTDMDGNLQSAFENWLDEVSLLAAEGCQIISSLENVEMAPNGARIRFRVQTCANQRMNMITGVTVGEPMPLDPARASLILRRMDVESLWELAKTTGSTMDAIRKANQLTQEPQQGQMLLIPVI